MCGEKKRMFSIDEWQFQDVKGYNAMLAAFAPAVADIGIQFMPS